MSYDINGPYCPSAPFRDNLIRMENQKLKEQVELIRQVFGYVDQFKGKTFVIKIGSRIIQHPFFSILVRDLVYLHKIGIYIVLVPGARERIDAVLRENGITWQVEQGIRITPTASIPFIKMAAFDVSNRIMTLLAENKTDAVIGNWVRARGIGVRGGVDFESAGIVDKLKIDIIRNVLDRGLVPIFPNIGWNERGKPYNLSSDELAIRIAQELGAEKLFFITESASLTEDQYNVPDGIEMNGDNRVSRFKVGEAREFLKANETTKEDDMLQLISLALDACESGIKRVHILDGRTEGVILKEIFSNQGFGTMIYTDEHSHIRRLDYADVPEVLRIMEPAIERDLLIPRTSGMIEDQMADFVVYEVDGIIHACGALHSFPNGTGEIAGIAVDETYGGMGLGRKLVTYFLDDARKRGMQRVFVLTTQTSDWFFQLGFRRGSKKELPQERRSRYDSRRRSAVLFFDL